MLDVGKIDTLADFVKDVVGKHADLDCVINNAGVQRPFQILGPDYDFDLAKADQEIDTNIRGPLHLSVLLVPHFNGLSNGGVIMNVSSVLGYLPLSLVNPVYNGTKAWVRFFSMNLRSQLRQAGSKIKVVEIVPPTIETVFIENERIVTITSKRMETRLPLARLNLWSRSDRAGSLMRIFARLGLVTSWSKSGMMSTKNPTSKLGVKCSVYITMEIALTTV